MTPSKDPPRYNILIVNPNSSQSMTEALKPLISGLGYSDTAYTYFTAPPASPVSIDDDTDAARSAAVCYPLLLPLLRFHQGVLIACYSVHPLVVSLRRYLREYKDRSIEEKRKGEGEGEGEEVKVTSPVPVVMGIFEASVTTSLHCLLPGERFGIVSTGRVWEALLTKGVGGMLGTELSATVSTSTSTSASTATPTSTSTTIDPAAATVRTGPSAVFAGVSTTGLSAAELHSLPSAEVRRRLRDATVRLLTRTPTKASSTDGAFADTDPDTISTGDNVDDTLTVINLGCAGMSGMQEAVREGCVAVLGLEGAQRIRVVDPVLAGVALLRGLIALG